VVGGGTRRSRPHPGGVVWPSLVRPRQSRRLADYGRGFIEQPSNRHVAAFLSVRPSIVIRVSIGQGVLAKLTTYKTVIYGGLILLAGLGSLWFSNTSWCTKHASLQATVSQLEGC
jgi:hypothetical protein